MHFSRLIIIATLTFIMSLTLAGAGLACCVYNDTTHPVRAQIGEFAGIDWKIDPTSHRCTDGTGGEVVVSVMDPFKNHNISECGEVKVDDHGWVSVYKKKDGKWKVVCKKKDGSVKQVIYLNPL